MTKRLSFLLFLVLLAEGDGIPKEKLDLISKFKRGKKIEAPKIRVFINLSDVKEIGLPDLQEYLFLLQSGRKEDLEDLNRLMKMHETKLSGQSTERTQKV